MTAGCAQLAQTGWVEEDATALSLAPDASALGPGWLADHWSPWLPSGGTDFVCLWSQPDPSLFLGALDSVGGQSSTQLQWEPGAEARMVTSVIGPWATPFQRTGIFVAPLEAASTFPTLLAEAAVRLAQRDHDCRMSKGQGANRLEGARRCAEDERNDVEDAGHTPLDLVRELKSRLDLTWQDAEEATGIDRNTFLNWQRTGAVPRPSTVRKLMRVYGLVSALESAVGRDGSLAWLHTGSPSWIDVLKRGDLSAFESAVKALLDGDDIKPSTLFAYRPEPDDDEVVPLPPARSFRKSDRPPRRSRLPGTHD